MPKHTSQPNPDSPNPDAQNLKSLRKLILTVEANAQSLELLIAVCDDRNLQARMMEQYEADLKDKGIAPFRVRLNPKEPSLKASVAALVAKEPRLQSGEPAVVTVLNAEALLGVTLGEETSEQERFFFSLQWTREALLRFNFAVVLWVPTGIAREMGRQAPDFWSWRGGVFEFQRVTAAVGTVPNAEALPQRRDDVESVEKGGGEQKGQSVEALLAQVEELEESAPESALLVTLYNDLGGAYERHYAYGEALVWYKKALALAAEKESLDGQARALGNLGDALRFSGRPVNSIGYYERALALYQKLGNRQGEAASLGNLGLAYDSLSQYQQAIDSYHQQLVIAREIGDHRSEANALGNLGSVYKNLGQYQQAIDFHQQHLEIAREIGDRRGEAASLGNLGIVYRNTGQYQQAIGFQKQQLAIAREISDRKGEAASLGNLGGAHYSLSQYQQAIDFQQQHLEIAREIGDRTGEATSIGNLGSAYYSLGQYQQSIDFHKQHLEIACEIGDRNGEARALSNLGAVYYALNQYQQAIDFYQQSLEIRTEIGDRKGEAIAQFNLGLAYAKIDEHWKALKNFEQAKALYAELTLTHKVEECEDAIRERNRIIASQPKQAPSLDTKPAEPDWWEKSLPTASRTQSPAKQSSPKRNRALTKWIPYVLFAIIVVIIIITLQ